jgi:hypothetical protein
MTIRLLEIKVGDKFAGTLRFVGPEGLRLEKVSLKRNYLERLTRKNLLIEGHDYSSFGWKPYKVTLEKGLEKELGERIYISEKKLDTKQLLLLHKYRAWNGFSHSYSNTRKGSTDFVGSI